MIIDSLEIINTFVSIKKVSNMILIFNIKF